MSGFEKEIENAAVGVTQTEDGDRVYSMRDGGCIIFDVFGEQVVD